MYSNLGHLFQCEDSQPFSPFVRMHPDGQHFYGKGWKPVAFGLAQATVSSAWQVWREVLLGSFLSSFILLPSLRFSLLSLLFCFWVSRFSTQLPNLFFLFSPFSAGKKCDAIRKGDIRSSKNNDDHHSSGPRRPRPGPLRQAQQWEERPQSQPQVLEVLKNILKFYYNIITYNIYNHSITSTMGL